MEGQNTGVHRVTGTQTKVRMMFNCGPFKYAKMEFKSTHLSWCRPGNYSIVLMNTHLDWQSKTIMKLQLCRKSVWQQ